MILEIMKPFYDNYCFSEDAYGAIDGYDIRKKEQNMAYDGDFKPFFL